MITKKNIILILITLIGIISVQKVLINKSKSNISLEEPENKIAVYVDGEKTDAFPTKTDGKVFEKIECTNSGVAEWDEANWKLTVKEINDPTVCNVYFIGAPAHLATNFYGTLVKNDIESIMFEDHMNIPSGVLGSWDASVEKNNAIKAWYTDTNSNGKYELVVGQIDGVMAPENSTFLFADFQNLNILNLNNFDTTKVTNMSSMFYNTGYNSTTFTLDLGDDFDTSNVTNMESMFFSTGYNSRLLTLNLGDKFDTSRVADMSLMFCSVGHNSPVFTLNLGTKFNTSKVTNMFSMFVNTGNVNTTFTLNLGSNFDTSNVTDMRSMFGGTGYNSTVFTLNLGSKFNMSRVTSAANMFHAIGQKNPNFYINARYATLTSAIADMSEGGTLPTHKFYVRDTTTASLIQSLGFKGTIVNCLTTSCP